MKAEGWKDFSKIKESSTSYVDFDFVYYNVDQKPIYYNMLSEEECEVTFYNEDVKKYKGDVIIPATVLHVGKEYRITKIGKNAFKNSKELTSVFIPTFVEDIADSAFYGCSGLTTITVDRHIPPVVGHYSFDNIGDIKEVTLMVPTGSINAYKQAEGWNIFENIKEFTSTRKPDFKENGIYYFVTSEENKTVEVTHNGNIDDEGYVAGNSYNGDVTIPSSVKGYTVTSIGEWAFYGSKTLTSVSIPESVSYIGEYAFGS